MKNREQSAKEPAFTPRDAAMLRVIREITGRGSNVEIRRKGEDYSIMEVRKKNIVPAP